MGNKFFSNFLVYGVTSSLSKFVGIFLVPIYTSVFTKEEYGSLDLLLALLGFFTILGMMQIESAVQRYYYEFKDEHKRNQFLSTAFWLITLFSLLFLVLVVIFSNELSLLFFKDTNYSHYIRLIILVLPLANLFSLYTVLFRFLDKPIRYSILIATQLLVTVSLIIWLVVYQKIGLSGVIYGQIAGYLVAVVLALFWFRDVLLFRPQRQYIKDIFSYSLPLVPYVISGWANAYANRFFMIGYLTLADIGIYSLALKIASAFSLVNSAFKMTWGPYLWKTMTQDDHKSILRKIPMPLLSILLLAVLLISVWSEKIILLVSSLDYIESSEYIGYICLSMILLIVLDTISLGPAIRKKTKYITIIGVLSMVINIALLFVLVPMLGLLGVVFSLLISDMFKFSISSVVSERLYLIGFPLYRMFFAVLVTTALIWALQYFDAPILCDFIFSTVIIGLMLLIAKPYLKTLIRSEQ